MTLRYYSIKTARCTVNLKCLVPIRPAVALLKHVTCLAFKQRGV